MTGGEPPNGHLQNLSKIWRSLRFFWHWAKKIQEASVESTCTARGIPSSPNQTVWCLPQQGNTMVDGCRQMMPKPLTTQSKLGPRLLQQRR